MIQVTDTHKLDYRLATLIAYSYADGSRRIPFTGPDGEDLGDTLYTNDEGFICYGSARHTVEGYFVGEKALIVCKLRNGDLIQWVTGDSGSGVVNDGKLLNKRGVPIFSANTPNNHTLSYNDLADTPAMKSWGEGQQWVYVDTWGKHVKVKEWCTVLKLSDELACKQRIHNCSYRKAIVLEPPVRPGQQLIVINDAAADMSIWSAEPVPPPNAENQYTGALAVLNWHEACLFGSDLMSDGTYTWRLVEGGTSLIKGDAANQVQYATFTPSDAGGVKQMMVNPNTSVVYVGAQELDRNDVTLNMVFSRDGQQVTVINGTKYTLYLSNTLPSSSNAKSASVEILHGCTGIVASAYTGSTAKVLRFWGFAHNSEDGIGDDGPLSRQSHVFKNFKVQGSYTGGANITLSEPVVLTDIAHTLQIRVDVSSLTIDENLQSGGNIDIHFRCNLQGMDHGQVLFILPVEFTGFPVLQNVQTDPNKQPSITFTMEFYQNMIDITKTTDWTTGKEVVTRSANGYDAPIISSLPMYNRAVHKTQPCTMHIIAYCSTYYAASYDGTGKILYENTEKFVANPHGSGVAVTEQEILGHSDPVMVVVGG